MWSTGDLLDWLPRLSKKTSAPPPSLQKIAAYPILLKDVKATSRFHVFFCRPWSTSHKHSTWDKYFK